MNSLSSTQIPLFLTVNGTKSDNSLKFPRNFSPLKRSFQETNFSNLYGTTTKYCKYTQGRTRKLTQSVVLRYIIIYIQACNP